MGRIKKILLIDDDEDDRKLFSEAMLEVDSSIECAAVGDSEKAIHFLKFNTTALPDIIFLDLNMPGKNGMQCLDEIKKTRKLRDIPVVIYSTSKTPEYDRILKEKGAAYFIIKPPSFREICGQLAEVIKDVESFTHVST